ncbi:hypothetical protein HDV06_005591 [Boothiomyces sp. JEL0866]|nr:hypothetical protein HDV06_005591 [Boothiomyces sp. JEL0866]
MTLVCIINLFLLAVGVRCLSPNGSILIKVGLLLDFETGIGDMTDPIEAVFLRIDQLNRQNLSLIHPNAQLVPTLLNNQAVTKQLILDTLHMTELNEIFVLGTGASSTTIISSLILQNYNIPMCCGASTNPTLSRKDLYPNFFRTIPNDNAATLTMAQYIISNGWSKIATINTDEDYGNGAISSFLQVTSQYNITVLSRQSVETNVNSATAINIAQQILSSDARIIVYFGMQPEYQIIVDAATKVGVYGKGYVWLTTDAIAGITPTPSLIGTIYLFPLERADGPVADSFDAYWKSNRMNMPNPPANLSSVDSSGAYGYFYTSCVDLMALGMDALVKANGNNATKLANGELNSQMIVPDTFSFPNFETASGKVELDKNGDRSGEYGIYNFQEDLSYPMVAKWQDGQEVAVMPYTYPGGSSIRPADSIDPTTVADYLQLSGDALGYLSEFLTALGVLGSIGTVIGILSYRERPIVRSSDVNSGLVMQLCICVSWFNLLTMISKPSKLTCTVDSVLLPITFTVYYGIMFIKNYRIYSIFMKPTERKKFSHLVTICLGAAFSVPIAIIVLIWNVIDAPKPAALTVTKGVYAWTCSSTSANFQNNIVMAISIYCAIVLGFNLYIAFKTRSIPSRFSETKMITLSIYNSVVICLFAIAILLSPGLGYRLKVAIKMVAVFYILAFNLLSSFTLKVVLCLKNKGGKTTEGTGNSNTSSQNNTKNKSHASKGDLSKKSPDTIVLIKKMGLFTEVKSRAIFAESQDLVTFCAYHKTSLEDKHGVSDANGEVWKFKNLKEFDIEIISEIQRKMTVNKEKYLVTFPDEAVAKSWDTYFQRWSLHKHSTSPSFVGAGMSAKTNELALNYFAYALTPNGSIIIKVGIILDYENGVEDMSDSIEASFLRIDQLNRNNSTLIDPDATLVPVLLNNAGATKQLILDTLHMTNLDVRFILGTGGSSGSIIASLILQNYNIPMCCGASTNPTLARKDLYPNFFRTIPNDNAATLAMAGYIASNGWSKVATINIDEDYGNGEIASFLTAAQQYNITILSRQLVETNLDAATATNVVRQILSSEARIIVYFGYVSEYQMLVTAATKVGVYGKGFVWLGTDGINGLPPNPAIAGTTFLFPLERSDGPVADAFDSYWKDNRLNTSNPADIYSSVNSSGPYGYFYTSCVDLMALGMDSLVKTNGNNATKLANGELNDQMIVPGTFSFPDFETTTGKVVLDSNGERRGDYGIYNFQQDLSVPMVAKWSNGKEYSIMPYNYPGGTNLKPADSVDPTTVADYLQTSGDGLGILAVFFCAVGIIASLVTAGGIFSYRSKQIIRASDMYSGLAMQLCILVSWLNLLTMINKPTKLTCKVDSFLLPVTFSVYYGIMFIKNYRIYSIFMKPKAGKFPTYLTIGLGFAFAVPAVIIVLIWNIVDSPVPTALAVTKGVYGWTCSSSSAVFQSDIVTAISVYCAVVLALNLLIAFKTRNIPSRFSETKMITMSIYNSVIICLFAIAILMSPGLGFRLKAGVKMVAVFYILAFNLLTSFSLKVYLCYQDKGGHSNTSAASGSHTSSQHADTSKKSNASKAETIKKSNDTVVLMKKVGFLSEAKSRSIFAESAELVTFASYHKLNLEDKNGVADGNGEMWKLRNLKEFKFEVLSETQRKYVLNKQSYMLTFDTEETAKLWDGYFQKWSQLKSAITPSFVAGPSSSMRSVDD